MFDAEAPYSYSIVVEAEPGVYQYSDVFEPGMTGTIVVLDADSSVRRRGKRNYLSRLPRSNALKPPLAKSPLYQP
jgi:hypothetical protein